MIFLGIIAVISILFSEPLVRFFIKETGVAANGSACLRCLAYGYLFYALGMAEKGVYVAILIAESMMTIVGVLIFRRGKWKKRRV